MLSQIIAVSSVNLRSIRQRLGSSTVAIIGIAGVVIVFLGVLSIGEGFKAAMSSVGDPRTIIVMRAGSDTEMTSGLSGDTARIVMDTPGIERTSRRMPSPSHTKSGSTNMSGANRVSRTRARRVAE